MEIKNPSLDLYRAQLGRKESLRTKESSTSKSGTTHTSAASPGDRVSVSKDAALLTEAFKVALSTPDVRQEKVNAIKERLERGEYEIDNERIAAGLLQAETELFRS